MRRALVCIALACACRSARPEPSGSATASAGADAGLSVDADVGPSPEADAGLSPGVDGGLSANAAPPDAPRAVGPFELPFVGKRNVFFVVPPARGAHRLMANLHGMCNPPGYACGYWVNAASSRGFLVCPTGNATCGPAMYDAPTWTESFAKMDEDLEKAIATVDAAYPGEVTRDGAILTGFSRGAFAAAEIVKMHTQGGGRI